MPTTGTEPRPPGAQERAASFGRDCDTLGGVLPLHPHLQSREVPQAAAPRSGTSWCHEGPRGRPSLHRNPKHTHSSTLHTTTPCPAHLTQSPASHRLQSCKFKSKADGLQVLDGENSSGDSARERARDKAAPPTGSAVCLSSVTEHVRQHLSPIRNSCLNFEYAVWMSGRDRKLLDRSSVLTIS